MLRLSFSKKAAIPRNAAIVAKRVSALGEPAGHARGYYGLLPEDVKKKNSGQLENIPLVGKGIAAVNKTKGYVEQKKDFILKNAALSREKERARKRVDALLGSSETDWSSFLAHARRKSFATTLMADPRTGEKLKLHVDSMNRLLTGKPIAKIQGSTGEYDIIRLRGGGIGCTCPAWRYKGSVNPGNSDCKHITQWRKSATTKIAMTAAEAHDALSSENVSWDNNEKFMAFSEYLTGKRHLDAMTPSQRKLVVQFAATDLKKKPRKGIQPGDILLVSSSTPPANAGALASAAHRSFGTISKNLQGRFTHAGIVSSPTQVVETHYGKGARQVAISRATKGKDFLILRPNVPKKIRELAAENSTNLARKEKVPYSLVGAALAGTDLVSPNLANVAARIMFKDPDGADSLQCAGLVESAYRRAGTQVINRPAKVVSPIKFLEDPRVVLVGGRLSMQPSQIPVPWGTRGRTIRARLANKFKS